MDEEDLDGVLVDVPRADAHTLLCSSFHSLSRPHLRVEDDAQTALRAHHCKAETTMYTLNDEEAQSSLCILAAELHVCFLRMNRKYHFIARKISRRNVKTHNVLA